jgi:hypothetical protein
LNKISLFEKLYEKEPDYSRLRVFGCKCFVLTDKNDKLSPKAIPCVFLGYLETQKGFRCYDIRNEKLYVSRNVSFLKNLSGFESLKSHNENMDYSFLFELLAENDDASENESTQNDSSDNEIEEFITPLLSPPHQHIDEGTSRDPITYVHRDKNTFRSALERYDDTSRTVSPREENLRRTERPRKAPSRFISYDSFSPKYRACLSVIHSYVEPRNFEEAQKCSE